MKHPLVNQITMKVLRKLAGWFPGATAFFFGSLAVFCHSISFAATPRMAFEIECQIASTNRMKYGFDACTNPCPVRLAKYRVKTYQKTQLEELHDRSELITYQGDTASDNYNLNVSSTVTNSIVSTNYTAYSGSQSSTTRSCGNITFQNTASFSGSPVSTYPEDPSAETEHWNNAITEYVNGVAVNSTDTKISGLGELPYPDVTSETNTATQTEKLILISEGWTNNAGLSDPEHCGWLYGTNTFQEHWTVSSEYQTSELVNASGLTYEDDEWYRATPQAFTKISDNELSGSVQKANYRFKVIAPPNWNYTIYYRIVYEADTARTATNTIGTNNTVTGVAPTNTFESLTGTGSGEWQYPMQSELTQPDLVTLTNCCLTNGCSLGADCHCLVGARRYVEAYMKVTDPDGNVSTVTISDGGTGDVGGPGIGGGDGGDAGDGQCSDSCSTCGGGFGGLASEATYYGMKNSFGLGNDSFNGTAGVLSVSGTGRNSQRATPDGLSFYARSRSVEAVRNGNTLRQVRCPEGLVDVAVVSGSSYRLDFYRYFGAKQGGLYSVSGYSPETSITVQQVDATTNLTITRINSGTTTVNQFGWKDADKGWTLVSGGGMKRVTAGWDSAKLEGTTTIRDENSQVAKSWVDSYSTLAGIGTVPIARSVNGGQESTAFHYYNNSVIDGTNFGRIKIVAPTTGPWTRYEYDTKGWLLREIHQFLNGATNATADQSRVIEYDYSSLTTNTLSCTRKIHKLLGQEIGRSYIIEYPFQKFDIKCQAPGAAYNDPNNLVTITTRNPVSDHFSDKICSVRYPDNTAQLFYYSSNETGLTVCEFKGELNATNNGIANGTKTTTVTGLKGEVLSRIVEDISSGDVGAQIESETYTYSDDAKASYSVTYKNGTSISVQSGCCGTDNETDAEGVTTYYGYDNLKRRTTSTCNSIATTTTYDVLGNAVKVTRTDMYGGDAVYLSRTGYDARGWVLYSTNGLGGVTSYSYSTDNTTRTTTYTNGIVVEVSYLDGRRRSVTGTAASSPVRYEYGVEADAGVQRAYCRTIKLDASGSDTPEWTKVYTDAAGHDYKSVYADGAYEQSWFNVIGQLWKRRDPDGVITLYQYDGKGDLEYTAVDINRNDQIDLNGSDRVTHTKTDIFLQYGYYPMRRTQTWQIDDTGTEILASEELSNLGWRHAESIVAGQKTTTDISGSDTTVTAPDGSYTVSTRQSGQLVSRTRTGYQSEPILSRSFGYDLHGRLYTENDGRNGQTSFTYNPADLVETVTAPPSEDGVPAQVTTVKYSNLLQSTNTIQPDGASVYTEYLPTGQIRKNWGSRVYPVEYTYDAQGRRKTMKTWQNFSAGTGAAVTTWVTNVLRGWVSGKVYDDGKATQYDYYPSGRVNHRYWARGTNTTYVYNNAGDLWSISYSDTTPGVTKTYDSRGRLKTVIHNGITTTLAYNDAGELASESYSGGVLDGLSVSKSFDQYVRQMNVTAYNGQTALCGFGLGYDGGSRLQTVSDGTNWVTYSYLDYSSLVGNVVFTHLGTALPN